MSKTDVVPMDVDSSTSPSPAEDDPITASYPVYLNPALPLGRRLLVLQHPNRTDDGPRAPPTELRLKAESGMVEVDVPLDYTTAYDKDKGVKWGRTLQQSSATKNGGSHGLAGGFGFGAVQQRSGGAGAGAGGSRRGTRTTEMLDDDDLIDWSEAVRQDKVLRTQTLGGQYPETDEVQYMVGVFQGKDLHLTPVSSLVHLRPQLHHLDATTQMERQAASKESSAPNGTGTTGAPSGGGSNAAPRAIHMTIKTTVDGETVAAETIADRLRSVQSEPWRKMKYTDENEEAAWDVYNESLFLTGGSTPAPQQQEDDKSTAANTPALDESVPAYASTWGEQAHLEAVSGMKKPVPVVVDEEELQQQQQQQQLQVKLQAAAAEKKAEEDKRPATRRPRGGAAAGARRGGRKASAA